MVQASIWRGLMAVGMKFHHFADPKPPSPNFKILIPSRLSPRGGTFKLVFYVPESYSDAPEGYRFPVVVNFHGGGFTLGTGTDDARWASSVIHNADAVLVSVEYRLAPEYPFSVGVEDGTDAVIYLASHAEELRLDPHRMALSGFSAGGNFAFTVPLMLHDLQNGVGKRHLADGNTLDQRQQKYGNGHAHHHGNTLALPYSATSAASSSSSSSLSRPIPSRQSSAGSFFKHADLEPTALEITQVIPDLTIKAIVSFYPPTDFRTSREEKRSTNPQPEKNLPLMLTNLFDQSYLNPTLSIDFTDPYLSPAAASDEFLKSAYPEDIVLYTCEYDMLNVEGTAFAERLSGPTIGKTIHGGLIKEVVHAFDKKPNPLRVPAAAKRCYAEACAELKRVFGGEVGIEDRRQLDKSKVVDRFEDEEDEEVRVEGEVIINEGGDGGTGRGRGG